MIRMYRAFAGDYAVKGYAEFVRLLLQGNKKAMLWHCTAGVIIADYLTTNEHLQGELRRLTAFVKQQAGTDSPLADESLRYLFGADEDFIKAYYEAAADKYGSMDGLIREGLGLSDRDREELKEMYLL